MAAKEVEVVPEEDEEEGGRGDKGGGKWILEELVECVTFSRII